MAHTAHMQSNLRLKEELTKIGLDHDWLFGTTESLVHRARMEMTLSFLKGSHHTHMMWIDADIEYEPEHISALWNMDADIAVGVYVMKKPGQHWFAAWKDGELVKDLDQFKEPIEVEYAGTGFMLIKREVIEAILEYKKEDYLIAERLLEKVATYNDREDRISEAMIEALAYDYEGPNGRVPALYMTPIHREGLESEDYHFCRYARLAGFKIMMDPNVRLKHHGSFAYGEEWQYLPKGSQPQTGSASLRTDPGISVPLSTNGVMATKSGPKSKTHTKAAH